MLQGVKEGRVAESWVQQQALEEFFSPFQGSKQGGGGGFICRGEGGVLLHSSPVCMHSYVTRGHGILAMLVVLLCNRLVLSGFSGSSPTYARSLFQPLVAYFEAEALQPLKWP